MDYNDLMIFAKQNKILQKQICDELGLTSAGFKRAVENKTLAIGKLEVLCKMLGITPNEFFGINNETVSQSVNSNSGTVTVTGIDRRQYYSDSPDVLKAQVELLEERIKEKDSQIKEKDSQIKEKDSQINSLLSILKGK